MKFTIVRFILLQPRAVFCSFGSEPKSIFPRLLGSAETPKPQTQAPHQHQPCYPAEVMVEPLVSLSAGH